jgi:hypothetical protein
MDEEKKSGVQDVFTGAVSPSTASGMEAESRSWMVQCPHCGYERSVWDLGGVRYKAAGTSRWLRRCPNCGKMGWHKVYRLATPVPAPAIPLPAAPARTRRRWLIWAIALGALAAVIIIGISGIVLLVNALTQPVVDAGDNFMTALKTGNYAQAYDLSSPALQKELGSVARLATLADNYRPARWNWTSRSIRNGVGALYGSMTYADGKPGSVHLQLTQVGNDWKIVAFQLTPTGG